MVKPQRRIPPRVYADYSQNKQWLREDFSYRCAYCFIHENDYSGYKHFHVDHFRPKGLPRFKDLETQYSNLLYSCELCNNQKLDFWPSDDPLADGFGWLDPCEHELAEHYHYAYSNGVFCLVSLTQVGRWMSIMLGLDQSVRIELHYEIFKKQEADNQMVGHLKSYMQMLEWKYEQDPTAENAENLESVREALLGLEKRIENHYLPKPMEPLRRNKAWDAMGIPPPESK